MDNVIADLGMEACLNSGTQAVASVDRLSNASKAIDINSTKTIEKASQLNLDVEQLITDVKTKCPSKLSCPGVDVSCLYF